MPNTAEFEKIETNLAKKLEKKEIEWGKIRDPFGEHIENATSTINLPQDTINNKQ